MATNRRVMAASPAQVWEVLADGWLYPLWVVGATRMREVDDPWPHRARRLHHSVGTWPLLLDDQTEALECPPGVAAELHAHAWPAGRADVVIRLVPQGAETEVVMEEQATAGPGALVPAAVQDPLLNWRNTESLRRLAFLAERRQRPDRLSRRRPEHDRRLRRLSGQAHQRTRVGRQPDHAASTSTPDSVSKSSSTVADLGGHRLVAEVDQHQEAAALHGEEPRRLVGPAGHVGERRVGELGVLAPEPGQLAVDGQHPAAAVGLELGPVQLRALEGRGVLRVGHGGRVPAVPGELRDPALGGRLGPARPRGGR